MSASGHRQRRNKRRQTSSQVGSERGEALCCQGAPLSSYLLRPFRSRPLTEIPQTQKKRIGKRIRKKTYRWILHLLDTPSPQCRRDRRSRPGRKSQLVRSHGVLSWWRFIRCYQERVSSFSFSCSKVVVLRMRLHELSTDQLIFVFQWYESQRSRMLLQTVAQRRVLSPFPGCSSPGHQTRKPLFRLKGKSQGVSWATPSFPLFCIDSLLGLLKTCVWVRLVIMVLRRCIGYRGRQLYTCHQDYAAVNPTLLPNNS